MLFRSLTSHSLLERRGGALVALPRQLLRVAEVLGVLDDVAAQLRRYAEDRARWQAWLARHDDVTPRDPVEDYWWPPDDDPTWTVVDTIAAA